MKYWKPYNESNPDAPYVNGDEAAGIEGSVPEAKGLEQPQREIVYAILQSGQTPSAGDTTQLWQAMGRAVALGARVFFANDTNGSANSLIVPTLVPATASLDDGDIVILNPRAGNTGPSSVTIGGIGTLPLRSRLGAELKAGDVAAGAPLPAVVFAGTLRCASFARSEVGPVAAQDPSILILTPAGSRSSEAFTAGRPIANFPGGSIGTQGIPNPYTLVQNLFIAGASYIDASGVVGFRATDATGSDCRARLIATGGGLTTTQVGPYLGCRTINYVQIPCAVGLILQNLDPAQAVNLQLIVDRTETAGTVEIYDPVIRARHNGNA